MGIFVSSKETRLFEEPKPQVVVAAPVQSGRITLPAGINPADAQFIRHGGDLELVLPDGRHVIIPHFFDAPGGHELASADGVLLPADLTAHLAGPLAPGQFVQNGGAAGGLVQIGMVDKLAGTVNVRHADGSVGQLAKGAIVYKGDVLETAGGASVGLIFADRSTFSLGGGGRMVLDELVYDPTSQSGEAVMSVMKGQFSFVSGQIAHSGPNAMLVRTPIMTIGVRGTTAAGNVGENGQTDVVLVGDPGGGLGQLILTNGAGDVQTLNTVNTQISMQSAFDGFSPPIVLPQSSIVANFGNAVASLPSPPTQSNMEWNTTPGRQQAPPVEQLQQREGANSVLDLGNPNGTQNIPAGVGETPPEDQAKPVEPENQPVDRGKPAEPPPPPVDSPKPVEQPQSLAEPIPLVVPGLAVYVPLPPPPPPPVTNNALLPVAQPVQQPATTTASVVNMTTNVYDGSAQTGALTIAGTPGNDIITGGSGADVVNGGLGNDTIDGGAGNDVIDGGAGVDVLTFASALVAVTVDLAAGSATGNGIDSFVGIEVIYGSAFADSMTGGAGADSMFGGAGNDFFVGGLGADYIDGGSGTDRVSYATAGSQVTVNLSTGTATGGAGADILVSIEIIEGSNFNDAITGNNSGNFINGGAGDDFIYAGNGADSLDGGLGDDLLIFANALSAVTVDLSAGTATGGSGNDFFSNFEGVEGSAFDDVLIGGAAAESFYGGDGDDSIKGGGGNDVIMGESGNNVAIYDGDVSGYMISAASIADINAVDGDDGIDTLSDVSTLRFNGVDYAYDPISGNAFTGSSLGDVLNIGSGMTQIDGGAGNDTITMSAVDFLTTIIIGGTGSDILALDDSADLTAGDFGAISGIEVLKLSGSTAQSVIMGASGGGDLTEIDASGASGSVQVDASTRIAALKITAGSADDILTGGTGADTLHGGAGSDVLSGGIGADTLFGGAGADVFRFTDNGQAATVADLGTDVIQDFVSGTDSINLSNIMFGLGGSGPLSTSPGSMQYAESAIVMSGTAGDFAGDAGASTGAGIIVIGMASGSGGVDIWYTDNMSASSTANSYQIAHLDGINTTQIADTDIAKGV